jgi:CRP-like cAMP-binding protein
MSLSPHQVKQLVNYLSQYSKASPEEIKHIITQLTVVKKNKGDVLILQGEPIAFCYFIVEGCVRQFSISPEGEEITIDFLCEHQAVAIFDLPESDRPSPFTFECTQDCLLIKGNVHIEETMLDHHPFLKDLIMNMLQAFLAKRMEATVLQLSSTPEQRYEHLIKTRPELLTSIPQHQIASYLGVKPESLSRIKRRISLRQ